MNASRYRQGDYERDKRNLIELVSDQEKYRKGNKGDKSAFFQISNSHMTIPPRFKKGYTPMMICIEKLSIQDADSLFQFEWRNRVFFEKSVPSRGDAYYQYDHFLRGLQALLDEQSQGISFFGLIKNNQGDILGRMNLVDIEKAEGIGHLGYRVGEDSAGKGIASQALKLFLEEHVPQLAVKMICAKTTTDNISSQKVLLKNGFEPYDMEPERADDFLHYRLYVV